MVTKQPCRLVGYVRVSTAKQGTSGLGLEAQVAAIAEHVASSGCELITTYEEVETGKRADRPQLALALKHAKRSKATLVIAKLDRLSRNVAFLSNLMEAKVDFVACDMPQADKFQIHIMVALAEKEAEMISKRTKAALQAAKARGTLLGGARLGHPKITSQAREKGSALAAKAISAKARDAYSDLAPLVAEMAADAKSLRKIAAVLNAQGHTTRTGASWSATQVSRVLRLAPPTQAVLQFRPAA